MPNDDAAERREQVAKQCDAIAHMAKAMVEVHTDYAKMLRAGGMDVLVDRIGHRTAAWMETLGDMLNGIDAVTEDDQWLTPIFEEAHRVYPSAAIANAPGASFAEGT